MCFRSMLAISVLSIAFANAIDPRSSALAEDAREVDIPSLLQKKCAPCHGPDVQEGELRLDSREQWLRGSGSGPIVDVENVSDSPILARIRSQEKGFRMPPEGDGLSQSQADALQAWIESGMPWSHDRQRLAWENHWAFQPLRRPDVPIVRQSDWVRNPIDSFILSRMESAGFQPTEVADSRTLLRRLTLDLTGLPPPRIEIDQSIADPQRLHHDALYEDLVARLIDSPRFGERWARHWLDVVRFAESDGFETNQPRPNAWPYRDWVIEAFNRDKPYDQFVLEQLAGDARNQDAATGFLVGGAWDRVKSPDPVLTANQRADELHDMVSTIGSSFLGLTIGCARCHSHKFDPISQREYYAIKACLSGVHHGERPLRSSDQSERDESLASIRESLQHIRSQLASLELPARLQRTTLIDDASSAFVAVRPIAGQATYVTGTGQGESDQSPMLFGLPNLGKQYRWWQPEPDQTLAHYIPRHAGQAQIGISWGAGFASHASDAHYVLDRDGDESTIDDQSLIATIDQRYFADGHPMPLTDQPRWSGFYNAGVHTLQESSRILVRSGSSSAPVTADTILVVSIDSDDHSSNDDHFSVPRVRAQTDSRFNTERIAPTRLRSLRLTIAATTDAEPCIDELLCFDSQGTNVARSAVPRSSGDYSGNPFHQLSHVNDGIFGNERSWISNEAGKGWVQLDFPESVTLHRIQWSRDGSTIPKYRDRVPTDYVFSASTNGIDWTEVASSRDRIPTAYPHAIPPYRLFPCDPEGRVPSDVLRLTELQSHWESKLAALEKSPMVYGGILGPSETTYRLHRGDPMQPKESVSPGCIEWLGGPASMRVDNLDSSDRLELAHWIASRDNPLTARVIVNRLWHYHFGCGIVDTPSDFGLNGGTPTHPELLDWLATELVEHEWSLKHIHRLMVCSATYRQSGNHNPRSDRKSWSGLTSDRWMVGFPRRRLEAEALRDCMLSITGSLRLDGGGPGFDLFEPNTNYVKVYESKLRPSSDTWRRMIFQSKPRMQLDNVFGGFDCPDAGQVAPKRSQSITPLQALSLLNSPFVAEQSTRFAARLEREEPGVENRIRLAFRSMYGRDADEQDVAWSAEFIREHGWESLCRGLLNSSEWMYLE